MAGNVANGAPNAMKQWKKVDGMIAAVFTPMNPDESLNLNLIASYVQHLLKNKVKGVFVNGTSGESMSLTIEERKVVAEAWIANSKGKLKVFVHVGAGNLAESRILAAHAESIGADAIGAMVPSFFKATSAEIVVDYLKQVASAAPSTPFLYYHFPGMNGVNFNFETVLSMGIKDIPTLVGAKFTAYEYDQAMGAAHLCDKKLEIFAGYDTMHLAGFAVGVTASISGVPNFLGCERQRMRDAFDSGRLEDALVIQRRIQHFSDIITGHGKHHFIPAYKRVFQLFHMNFGPSRTPIAPVSLEDGKTILEELIKENFMDYVNL